jgi:hypothetical protein
MAEENIGIKCGLSALDDRNQVLTKQTTQINSGKINPKSFRDVNALSISLIVEKPTDGTLLVVKYTLRIDGIEGGDYQQIKTLPMKLGESIYRLSPILWGDLYSHYGIPPMRWNDLYSPSYEWFLKVSASRLKSSDFREIDSRNRPDYLRSLRYSKIKKFSWVVQDRNSNVDRSGDLIRPTHEDGRVIISAEDV